MIARYAPGALVTARGRDWVVLPDSEDDMLVLRPLAGADDEVAAVFLGEGPGFEAVTQASFEGSMRIRSSPSASSDSPVSASPASPSPSASASPTPSSAAAKTKPGPRLSSSPRLIRPRLTG